MANVSNPYSFNITSNKSFTGSCAVNLPVSTTYLFKDYNEPVEDINITIPTGVKVIAVSASAEGYSMEECGAFCSVYNINNKKSWGYASDSGSASVVAYFTNYIGVTPGKTYRIHIDAHGEFDASIGEGGTSGECEIYYSASINNHSIDIADY